MSVPADLMTNTADATTAYSDALRQAHNASNSLFLSYGFQSPDASGNYNVAGAQTAFDPMTLFKDANTVVDPSKVKGMIEGLQVGGTGKLADIMKAGATSIGDVSSAAAQAGFSGESGVSGGIISQRQQLARSAAQKNLQAGKEQFVSDYAQSLQPLGQASRDDKAMAEAIRNADRIAAAENQVYSGLTSAVEGLGATAPTAPSAPTSQYVTKGTPGGSAPANPHGGTIYKGPGGVTWQYRINGPQGRGWYK